VKRLIAIVGPTLLATPVFADPQSEISAYRKSRGLSAATVDAKLTELARKQATAMAEHWITMYTHHFALAWRPMAHQ